MNQAGIVIEVQRQTATRVFNDQTPLGSPACGLGVLLLRVPVKVPSRIAIGSHPAGHHIRISEPVIKIEGGTIDHFPFETEVPGVSLAGELHVPHFGLGGLILRSQDRLQQTATHGE